MATSRVMGTGVPQWPSDEAATRRAKVPHGESPVKGETSTLCKERASGGHRPDTDRRHGSPRTRRWCAPPDIITAVDHARAYSGTEVVS